MAFVLNATPFLAPVKSVDSNALESNTFLILFKLPVTVSLNTFSPCACPLSSVTVNVVLFVVPLKVPVGNLLLGMISLTKLLFRYELA